MIRLMDLSPQSAWTERVRAFEERMAGASERLKLLDKAVVCTHHDCDGMTSGGIMTQALRRAGVKVDTITLKQLYSEDIARLAHFKSTIVFTDFGSGYIPLLQKEMPQPFYILDHHQKGEGDFEGHLNPMQFGLDGGTEISAAGIAYWVAKGMDPKNKDLSSIGVVGAVGDMQDARTYGLQGMNAVMLQEGVAQGVLDVKKDLRLYGRISRPLVQYISFCTNPILPSLTANPENSLRFLQSLGIPLQTREGKWRSYEELDPDEKKTLSTALILHLHEHKAPPWKLDELVGEVYTLVKENEKSPLRDAKEFSTVLNACGRNGQSTIGFEVCMGDREDYYARAMGLLQEHRRNLAEGIRLMQEEGLKTHAHFYFFDAEQRIKDTIVGIVAGMLYGSGTVPTDKPIVAFARHTDGSIKVSARATSELVRGGVNLGLALRETCLEIGKSAEGGGHKIAAGCRIEADQAEAFLKAFDTKLGQQMDGNIKSLKTG
ncbi:MAG: DHH family phosphoesterase [Candidatus Diapherotrites archaeon]|nr:DHH family phosphoesterase [Candidatus Diapherotrites archaeon]MDZ4256694.1 DHH family phosphoesterase [archaeon]